MVLEVVVVEVAVTAGPDEVAQAQIRLLGDHGGEEGIRRYVEGQAKKNVGAALIKLA